MCVETWINEFNNGRWNHPSADTQIEAGWYDWFCRNTSLANKTQVLGAKVKRLAKSSKIDTKRMYVWFKNNCPLYGKLYDDFRFSDIETGDVVYTIVPEYQSRNNEKVAEVWGRENDFDEPLYSGDWKGVLAFFGV